jgi:hypothetical protein
VLQRGLAAPLRTEPAETVDETYGQRGNGHAWQRGQRVARAQSGESRHDNWLTSDHGN